VEEEIVERVSPGFESVEIDIRANAFERHDPLLVRMLDDRTVLTHNVMMRTVYLNAPFLSAACLTHEP
tara:strand:+ start:906 stop:1109 length:204 start_codon:yes stop_codon:yes gene_type:complete